jgi:Ni/Co efflux regulator RcnB
MQSRFFIWTVALAALAGAPAQAADKCKDGKCPPPARPAGRPAPQPRSGPMQQHPQTPVFRPGPPGGGAGPQQQPNQPSPNFGRHTPSPYTPAPNAQGGNAGWRNGPARTPGAAGHPTNGPYQGGSYRGTTDGRRAFGPNQGPRAYGGQRGYRVGMGAPVRSRSGHAYVYQGRRFGAFQVGRYRWPRGYDYRRYGIGYRLPRMFWLPDYYILDYADYGLPPPGEGLQWIRYGPDMLLVNIYSGEVVDAVYGAFEETNDVQDAPDGYYDSGQYPPPDDQPPPQ